MILKNTPMMRDAFSMITAIFLILLMASIAAFVMNLSGKMVQETTIQYKQEQAILYAKSYTEFAVMAATARNCINTIDANISTPATGDGYWITVNAQYIGDDLGAAVCPTIGNTIATVNSRGAIMLLDTYVRYRNPDVPDIANSPWITYHRRTLQRL